jgi:PIN domain nuclease of toxin-antitoxin system
MRVLLDTHTFIWWDADSGKLSRHALAICIDPQNTLLLSVVSVWEMVIKSHLGKLTLRMPLVDIITNQQRQNQIDILPVLFDHVLAVEQLPAHHKDPFDRLLIAQATVESATLLSSDPVFAAYSVSVFW